MKTTKSALRSFWEEIQNQIFNIYNFNEAVKLINIYLNKLLSEESKVLRTLFEGSEVAGSAMI